MQPSKQGGEILAIFKVVRNLKLKHLGWITSGKFVWCRAIFAKNYVIRHELIKCPSKRSAMQDAVTVNAIWIDSMPEPKKIKKSKKQRLKSKPKTEKVKSKEKIKARKS